MNFYQDVFIPLCAKRGISPTAAAINAGLSKTMVTNWKRRGSNPTAVSMQKIADYFGMTVQEMLSQPQRPNEEEQPAPNEGELSAEQAALIAWCRTLSPDEAAAALATLIAIRRSQPRPGSPG